MFLSEKNQRRIIFILIMFSFVLYSLRPFLSLDTLIYSVIGRGIYEHGIMPYDYVFDHKPIFTYYIYGLIDKIFGYTFPKFQLISVVIYFLTAQVISKILNTDVLTPFSLLIATSLRTIGFSCNTELFMSLLVVVSILLATSKPSGYRMFLLGIICAVSVNINYLTVFILPPLIVYIVFSAKDRELPQKIKHLLCIVNGGVLGLILIFAPFYFLKSNFIDYLVLQKNFLSNYKGSVSLSAVFSVITVTPLYFMLLYLVRKKIDINDKNNRIFIFALVLSLVAAFQSQRLYPHYFYLIAPWVVCLFINSGYAKKNKVTLCLSIFCFVYSLMVIMRVSASGELRDMRDISGFMKIENITKSNPVLTYGADHYPFYFSSLNPAIPYIFSDHVNIIFKDKANDYYLNKIKRKFPFILAKDDVCSQNDEICQLIDNNYQKVLTTSNGFYGRYWLYQIKNIGDADLTVN